jgi:hypothetical protein
MVYLFYINLLQKVSKQYFHQNIEGNT